MNAHILRNLKHDKLIMTIFAKINQYLGNIKKQYCGRKFKGIQM